ncbi:hypothetical protein ACKFKF_23380 [Phormidesmis sp. 146-12]
MPDLRPGGQYYVGFDWGNDEPSVIANGNGIARFENVDFPEPYTSDGARRAVIFFIDPEHPWIETVVQAPYLAEIPGC